MLTCTASLDEVDGQVEALDQFCVLDARDEQLGHPAAHVEGRAARGTRALRRGRPGPRKAVVRAGFTDQNTLKWITKYQKRAYCRYTGTAKSSKNVKPAA